MSGGSEKSRLQIVAAHIKRAVLSTAALGLANALPFAGSAPALTGAKNIGPDDIGAKASVALSYRGGQVRCGGAVFRDRYILTTAHCFTNGKGAMTNSADGWEVSYWSSDGAKRETRRVAKVIIHENFLRQEKATYPAPQPWDYQNFPIQHEDIAVLEISGTHPASAISVAVSPIDNEYTAKAGESWRGATWLYLYGASVNGSGWKLQRALLGSPGLIDRVIPGKAPDIMYIARKLVISTTGVGNSDNFMKQVSGCSGDSGTGLFLLDPKDIDYDDNPSEVPTTVALKDGLPILVGLMSNTSVGGLVTDVVPAAKKRGCGREVRSEAIIATRVDYHHGWIISKTGGATR
jgi:Trypsin